MIGVGGSPNALYSELRATPAMRYDRPRACEAAAERLEAGEVAADELLVHNGLRRRRRVVERAKSLPATSGMPITAK